LTEASGKGRISEIDKILSQGAEVNFQGKEGMTALSWAFLQGNRKGYQYLSERGANPDLQMTRSTLTSDGLIDGNSPMSLASMHEDPWYLEITLKHIWNAVKGESPIFQCMMLFDHLRPRPRIEQLKMLIASGADLNARNRSDLTPLMNAAQLNRYDMTHILLKAGADPELKTKWGTTIIYEINESRTEPTSVQYQWKLKVIEFLKTKGIDVGKTK
jgi:uncharacterized protein